jgi:hypothetical protein
MTFKLEDYSFCPIDKLNAVISKTRNTYVLLCMGTSSTSTEASVPSHINIEVSRKHESRILRKNLYVLGLIT